MPIVLTSHIVSWFTAHPRMHRTDQQGTRIICPKDADHQLHAHELAVPKQRLRTCPHCFATLQPPTPIDGEDREVQWPPAA